MRLLASRALVVSGVLGASAAIAFGCSSDATTTKGGPDASTREDSGSPGAAGSTSSAGASGSEAGSATGSASGNGGRGNGAAANGGRGNGAAGVGTAGNGAGGLRADAGQSSGGRAPDGGQDSGLGPDSVTGEVSQMIGVSGGTLTLDGASLVIPASALRADTKITMRRWKNPLPIATYSPRYEFLPEGTTFARPLTLTLPFTGDGDARVYWSAPAGKWEYLGGTINGATITATVRHFSSGGVGGGGVCPEQGGNTFCNETYGPTWTCCVGTIFGVTGPFCFDYGHDPSNCGTCGKVCAANQYCLDTNGSVACVSCGAFECP